MSVLERVEHASGVVTWRSPALAAAGVPHGFSTRLGGVSAGCCASLNLTTHALGEPVDEPENVRENGRRLRAALGMEERALVRILQVHGADVALAEEARAERVAAAASASGSADFLCSVSSADCLPILIARADGRAVAAVHAGWRGLLAGVVQRALEVLRERHGAAAPELVAAIGPAISVEHFEVGEDVARAFARAGWSRCVRRAPREKPRVDLPAVAAEILLAAGLAPERVDRSTQCTFREEEELFSHRRDGARTGRQVGWIAAR